MARKELTVKTIVVSFDNGIRIERNWDDIPEEEQKIISRNITDKFMEAMGYIRTGEYEPSIQSLSTDHNSGVNIVFDAREAAEYLNVSYITVLRMARRKQLPHHRIGRKLLFRKDSLDAWIQEQEQ